MKGLSFLEVVVSRWVHVKKWWQLWSRKSKTNLKLLMGKMIMKLLTLSRKMTRWSKLSRCWAQETLTSITVLWKINQYWNISNRFKQISSPSRMFDNVWAKDTPRLAHNSSNFWLNFLKSTHISGHRLENAFVTASSIALGLPTWSDKHLTK